MEKKTDVMKEKKEEAVSIASMLEEVYTSLEARGYNPVEQLVGYFISGDPGYIPNFQKARKKILTFDRAEILSLLLKEYLNK